MKYVLHIGMPKTGTTSLQQAFLDHQEALRQQGVVYPNTGILKNSVFGNARHHGLMEVLNGRDPELIGMPVNWEEKFREETADAEICVISSESFHRLHNPEVTLSLFPRDRTLVVIYLREPVAHVVSRFANRIRWKNLTANLLDFAKLVHWSNLDIVDRWSRTFGSENVALRLFDHQALCRRDIVADFANIVRPGLDEVFSNREYKFSPTISGNLLFVKSVLNFFIDSDESVSVEKEVTEMAKLDPEFQGNLPVDRKTVDRIASLHRKDCEALGKRFGLSIEPRSKEIEGPAFPNRDRLAHDFMRIQAEARANGGNLASLLDRMSGIFFNTSLSSPIPLSKSRPYGGGDLYRNSSSINGVDRKRPEYVFCITKSGNIFNLFYEISSRIMHAISSFAMAPIGLPTFRKNIVPTGNARSIWNRWLC